MSIEYSDECCDCTSPGYPCLGKLCPNRNVPHIYCDGCGTEDETMYKYNDKDFCKDCLVDELVKSGIIKESEIE